MFVRLLNRARRRLLRQELTVWYSPQFRLPLAAFESTTGMEPRRADYAVWYLLDRRVVPLRNLRTPTPIAYADLARVHSAEYLESLSRPEVLANIFAATAAEISVDEVLHTVRLACGATLGATRETLRTRRPAMALLGGFHHAKPSHGVGFCAVNDLAVAVKAVRAEGFLGRICVLDLDAHPPDGTAACLHDDPAVWIGSLSGSDWGPLDGVDEIALPPQSSDAAYLAALDRLLDRMPKPDLAFVLAGGDVLAGDRFGALALTLDGARRRDLRVARALRGLPSVWLPAGGYNRQTWRVLAGTAIALALRTRRPIRDTYDPLTARFSLIASGLTRNDLGADDELDSEDIAISLGLKRPTTPRLLGFYTAEGLEFAFYRYGILNHLERLGYRDFRPVVDEVGQGDRLRLFGRANGTEHLLIELVVAKQRIGDEDFLYVHWLALRHPRIVFEVRRPALPGQDAPGLGLAREAGEMLARMAERQGLAGVAFRPAWFHTAYSARYHFRFLDPERQHRFEALIRDLGHLPLIEVTNGIANGRVRLNGQPYTWEPDVMAFRTGALPAPPPVPRTNEWEFTLEPNHGQSGGDPAPACSTSARQS